MPLSIISRKPKLAIWRDALKQVPPKRKGSMTAGEFVVTDGVNVELQSYYDYKWKRGSFMGWEYHEQVHSINMLANVTETDKARNFRRISETYKVKDIKYWCELKDLLHFFPII
jgi:hypothetical protein